MPDGQKHYYGVVIRKLLYNEKSTVLRCGLKSKCCSYES